jgi:hypothetical protein
MVNEQKITIVSNTSSHTYLSNLNRWNLWCSWFDGQIETRLKSKKKVSIRIVVWPHDDGYIIFKLAIYFFDDLFYSNHWPRNFIEKSLNNFKRTIKMGEPQGSHIYGSDLDPKEREAHRLSKSCVGPGRVLFFWLWEVERIRTWTTAATPFNDRAITRIMISIQSLFLILRSAIFIDMYGHHIRPVKRKKPEIFITCEESNLRPICLHH